MKRLNEFLNKLIDPPNNFYEWLTRLIGVIGFLVFIIYALLKGILAVLSMFIFAFLVLIDLPLCIITLGIYNFKISNQYRKFINDVEIFEF